MPDATLQGRPLTHRLEDLANAIAFLDWAITGQQEPINDPQAISGLAAYMGSLRREIDAALDLAAG